MRDVFQEKLTDIYEVHNSKFSELFDFKKKVNNEFYIEKNVSINRKDVEKIVCLEHV